MRSTTVGFVIALTASVWSPALAQERCEPSACLAVLSANVPIAVADVPASEVAGLWKSGDGLLSGENLYLFPDGSYIYTEWGDLLPETIYDKGEWRIDAGVVRLSPNAAIAWNPKSDRRFAALTVPARTGHVLVGLDRTLECFLELVREHPDTSPAEWLEVSASKRRGAITAGETEALTQRLHQEGWRPGFFADTAAVDASERTLARLREVIAHADHVEALPVSMIGDGSSSEPHVEERPVPVDAKTGKTLASLLTGYDWSTASPMNCLFTPQVAFRFRRGDTSAQVLVSFGCGEMVLDGLDGPLAGKKLLGGGRKSWLKAAQRSFPGDPLLTREK